MCTCNGVYSYPIAKMSGIGSLDTNHLSILCIGCCPLTFHVPQNNLRRGRERGGGGGGGGGERGRGRGKVRGREEGGKGERYSK